MGGSKARRKILARFGGIQQVRPALKREDYPRLQMSLVVAITAGAGFLSSYLLLHAGITAMWLRYPIAVAIGYVVFLFLLWLWLRRKERDRGDAPDLSSTTDLEVHYGTDFAGKGGEGGGGGASGSFDGAEPGSAFQSIDVPSLGDAVSSAAEAEEFAIPLILLVLLVALLLASLWAIVAVPILLADLLLYGVLGTILYRRLRQLGSEHWIESAVRITLWPFVAVVVVAMLCGWGMTAYAPDAHSIGQVVNHLRGL